MKKKIVLALSSVMLLITLLIFFVKITSIDSANFKINEGKGQITLNDLENVVKLNGEWEFYPNELMTPQELKQSDIKPSFINVPKVWKGKVDSSKVVETGTYRVLLKLPNDDQYAFRFNSIHNDNIVFINGEKAGGLGKPTKEISKASFTGKKFTVYGTSVNKEIEIVIQVSHNLKMNGGIVKPIHFGIAEKVDNFTIKSIIIDSLFVSGTLLIGILSLLNSILQRKVRGDLFFTLYCFSQAIYFSTQNEKIVLLFIPKMNMYTLWSWQFGSLYLAIIFLMFFTYFLFKEFASKKLMVFTMSLMGLSWIILLINRKSIVNEVIYNIQTTLILMYLIASAIVGMFFIIFTMIKGILNEKEDYSELIIFITAFACYGLCVGFKNLYEVDMGYLPVILQVILILSIAYSISNREEQKNRKIHRLSKEIVAEQKLKDELILKVSEGLETPLLNIIQSSNKLMDGRIGPLNPEQQESVNTIHLAINKLQRLITDLVSGIQFKGQTYLVAHSTILKMLNELIYEVSFFIKDSNKVKIKTDFSENIPVIYADMKLLKQALFNVLHNAVKYTESGEIIIRTFEKDDFFCITVEDTGIGIEKNKLKDVFHLFYKVSNVPQNQNESLGIGLSIAQQYIKVMNGKISIDSKLGTGTTVTILLPIYNNEDTRLIGSTQTDLELSDYNFPIHLIGEKEKSILIIDENKEQLLYMAKMLEKNGYNVFAYNHYQEIRNVMKNYQVDLVLIDIYMPKDFIFNFVETVRKFYQKIELPIILLAKTDRLYDVKMLFEKGVNGVKRWPIIEEEFISHIDSLLSMQDAVEHSVKQELRAYHTQITPHFLYNTLNTIIGLSYEDVEKSREALEHLSVYFRAKLDIQKQQSLIPIEEEIELVQAYVLIEKLRFKHLNVYYDIDKTIDIEIPSLTLQPLVENAIQHGLVNKQDDARLFISVQQVNDYIEIVIEDNGVGMSEEQKSTLLTGHNQRLGFINPFNKIKLLKNSHFELQSEIGKGTKIVILLKNTQASLIE